MKTVSTGPKAATTPPLSSVQATLHQRILALVEQLGEASDIAVWRASQPQYFPWAPFWQALRTLHAAGKLALVMRAPGDWWVRSLAFVAAATATAPQTPKPRAAKPVQPVPTPPQAAPKKTTAKPRAAAR